VVAFDDGQRPEAVVLDFVQPVGMVERLKNPDERHRAGDRHGRSAYRTRTSAASINSVSGARSKRVSLLAKRCRKVSSQFPLTSVFLPHADACILNGFGASVLQRGRDDAGFILVGQIAALGHDDPHRF